MIGYVTLGTNNFSKAAEFYDALLGEIGAKRTMQFETFIVWSTAPGAPSLSICKPYNGQPATVGNGVMVALFVDSPDKVNALYAKAMLLGATDEGEPGSRGGNFYAAYFRDLDGNKLNFFTITK
jgi:catechol 2,3-dioxygenase-like lactoylglutathione lyase family enzyme